MLCVSLELVELSCSRVIGSLLERRSERESFTGESASPFTVERDGLTSQRERERESVYVCCQALLLMPSSTGWLPVPTILFMPRCVWQALPCSPGTTNIDAHNTVYALTCLEVCRVSVCHGLVAPSSRCAGYGRVWSSILRLT